jgi:hypothetical protein
MKNYIEIEIYCLRDNYESWTSARTRSWSWHHDRKKKKKKGLQTFDFRGNTASKYIIYFLLLI